MAGLRFTLIMAPTIVLSSEYKTGRRGPRPLRRQPVMPVISPLAQIAQGQDAAGRIPAGKAHRHRRRAFDERCAELEAELTAVRFTGENDLDGVIAERVRLQAELDAMSATEDDFGPVEARLPAKHKKSPTDLAGFTVGSPHMK